MPFFPPVAANGISYDLSHLNPFVLRLSSTLARKTLGIGVRFSNHCFTQGYELGNHPEGFPVLLDAGHRQRSFCHVRYEYSFQLPTAIRGLLNSKAQVWQTAERRNWVYSMKVENPNGPYHVFFELRRSRNPEFELGMVVESAYPEDPKRGSPNILGKMGFALLCGKVYTGQPVATKR